MHFSFYNFRNFSKRISQAISNYFKDMADISVIYGWKNTLQIKFQSFKYTKNFVLFFFLSKFRFNFFFK